MMIIDINDQKVNEKGQYTLPNGDKTSFSMVYKDNIPLRKLVELLERI